MMLPLRIQKQLLENWCWAAVTSSISFYYNKNMRGWQQSQLAGRLLDGICANINRNNADSAPGLCDRQLDIARPLSATGHFAGQQNRPLTPEEIVSQINSGFPVCCQVLWTGLTASHFVVLYGYEGNRLIIGDPDPDDGGAFFVDYHTFLNNYRNGGQWVRTIATQRVRV
jgi:hypothetical protein